MLWDAYQQTRIADAERVAESAESKAERLSRSITDLQRQVDRLSLACQALWEMLRERSDMTEEELDAKILETDGRDGSVDGKIGVQAMDCPSCGRKTNSKRSSCLMCGAPLKRPSQFIA
jgi:hypothetical protein